MLGVAGVGEGLGVEAGARADDREPGEGFGDVGGPVDGRVGHAGAGVGVPRPVHLLAARVRGDGEGLVDPGGVREAVEGAQAVHGHAERGREGRGRDEADAQTGVRAGADADDHAGDRVELQPGLGEDPIDGGQQQLPVAAGVDLARRGDDGLAVVEGDGDGGVAVSMASNSTRTAYGSRARCPDPRGGGCYRHPRYVRTRGGHGGTEQLGIRGRAHGGGGRRGLFPRLPGLGERSRRPLGQAEGHGHGDPSTSPSGGPKQPVRDPSPSRRTRAPGSGSCTAWPTAGCGW